LSPLRDTKSDYLTADYRRYFRAARICFKHQIKGDIEIEACSAKSFHIRDLVSKKLKNIITNKAR